LQWNRSGGSDVWWKYQLRAVSEVENAEHSPVSLVISERNGNRHGLHLLPDEERVRGQLVCGGSCLDVHLCLESDHHGKVLPPVSDDHAVRQCKHLALR
jgi:hypothetical protein